MENIKKEFVQVFGQAYERFGRPRLMGYVVGLLLCNKGPLSLEDIAKKLEMSKGPVSQMVQRLREEGIINRIALLGDRRDFYQVHKDAFKNAFLNRFSLVKDNIDIANKFSNLLMQSTEKQSPDFEFFQHQVNEMHDFYSLMITQYENLLSLWEEKNNTKF